MSASTFVEPSALKAAATVEQSKTAAATVPGAVEQSTEGRTSVSTVTIVSPDGSRLPVDVISNEVIAELRQQICVGT